MGISQARVRITEENNSRIRIFYRVSFDGLSEGGLLALGEAATTRLY